MSRLLRKLSAKGDQEGILDSIGALKNLKISTIYVPFFVLLTTSSFYHILQHANTKKGTGKPSKKQRLPISKFSGIVKLNFWHKKNVITPFYDCLGLSLREFKRWSTLIQKFSALSHLRLSAVHYLNICEQPWILQFWKTLIQRKSEMISSQTASISPDIFMVSESVPISAEKRLRQRYSELIISGTSTRVKIFDNRNFHRQQRMSVTAV